MNIIKKILLINLLLCINFVVAFSQNTLSYANNYKASASKNIENNQYSQAIENAEKALSIYQSLDKVEDVTMCYLMIANIHSLESNDSKAMYYYLKAEEISIKNDLEDNLAQIYSQIGFIYFKINDFRKSAINFKKAVEQSNEDENIINLKFAGKSYFYLQQYDTALIFYERWDELAVNQADEAQQIKAIESIISVYKKQKKYDEAIDKNFEIYDIYTIQNNNLGVSLILNNIAYNFVLLEKYEDAIDAYENALKFGKDANMSKTQLADLYANIGVTYHNFGEFDKSIENLKIAYDLRKTEDNKSELANLANLIALIYFSNNDLYNASTFSEESIEIAEESGDKHIMQLCYETYSLILQNGNDYQNALEYYKKHLRIRDSLLIEQKLKEQDFAKKISDLERSEEELKLKLAEEEEERILKEKEKIEKEKQFLKIENENKQKDLLIQQKELEEANLRQQQQALIMEKQGLEARKKHQEIEALEKEKEIRDLELQKQIVEQEKRQQEIAFLESEQERQKLEIDKGKAIRKMVLWISVLFGIIFVLIVIFLIIARRSNRKLNKQQVKILEQNTALNSQKEEILSQRDELQSVNEELHVVNEEINNHRDVLQEKHTQITDSITYASRIQTAMLPESTIIPNFFAQYFVFYKPRDIVSGDFYWAKLINNDTIVIAAADCTGHGVPGAFVSMLGISFLNEIVNKDELTNANTVLDTLREKIKTSLKQQGNDSESKDGMDIAVCIIDKKNMKLQYSGAHNPLYIIRKEEVTVNTIKKKIRIVKNEQEKLVLTEIKADHQPIGVYIKERPFSNIEIDIRKNDRMYIFSDGYIDQFGGVIGQKYKSKTFKKSLLTIQHLSITEQKEYLIKEFEDWKGKLDQLDDILVMGFDLSF